MNSNPSQTFQIPTIACSGCISAISLAIAILDPDAKIESDLPTKTFKFETKLDDAKIRTAIAELGHTVA
jgi:copper chaperone